MDSRNTPGETLIEELRLRTRELEKEGLESSLAWDKAYLQYKVDHWPEDWGQTLHVLIYGDFNPPNSDLNFSELGISIGKEPQPDTPVQMAGCVLKALVQVHERSLRGLVDAIGRVNTLLGGLMLVSWGNGGCGWWCDITHQALGSSQMNIEDKHLGEVVNGTLKLQQKVRRKVEAALYWIREPHSMVKEWHRKDVLRIFSAYWNAFECLVDAIDTVKPREKLSKSKKQERIDEFVQERQGHLTATDVVDCYREIVSPGLVPKATHALEVCFGSDVRLYADQCFHLREHPNRLYNVRNAINHGDIDAEDPDELLRVSCRLGVLWFIVWRMCAYFLRFRYPADCPTVKKQ